MRFVERDEEQFAFAQLLRVLTQGIGEAGRLEATQVDRGTIVVDQERLQKAFSQKSVSASSLGHYRSIPSSLMTLACACPAMASFEPSLLPNRNWLSNVCLSGSALLVLQSRWRLSERMTGSKRPILTRRRGS